MKQKVKNKHAVHELNARAFKHCLEISQYYSIPLPTIQTVRRCIGVLNEVQESLLQTLCLIDKDGAGVTHSDIAGYWGREAKAGEAEPRLIPWEIRNLRVLVGRGLAITWKHGNSYRYSVLPGVKAIYDYDAAERRKAYQTAKEAREREARSAAEAAAQASRPEQPAPSAPRAPRAPKPVERGGFTSSVIHQDFNPYSEVPDDEPGLLGKLFRR